MSVFRVYVNDRLFYHPAMSQLLVTKAELKEDAENIDSFTLCFPNTHPYADLIRPMQSFVTCKSDDTIVFQGRVISDETDLNGSHTVLCEGCLSYLRDTIQTPFEFTGTMQQLLTQLLTRHNACVDAQRQLQVGTITVVDSNDNVPCKTSDYPTTLDLIRERLLGSYGGYLRVRHVGNTRYLDYLADFSELSLQTVSYGKNLLDVHITREETERCSYLIPLGATNENTEQRVTIEGVNGGLNYVYDAAAEAEIGKVWKTEVWDDVTLPENLLTKANKRIQQLAGGVVSMELSIVEEPGEGEIHARQYVQCESPKHGLSGRYLCLERTRDFISPFSDTVTIGATGVKLSAASAKTNSNIQAIRSDLFNKETQISVATAKADDASDKADAVTEEIRQCYSEITKTAEQITSTVAEEYVSKSDMETIQRDFSTSITQTGEEIRMDFISVTNEISDTVTTNQELLEEYIRFKGAMIELGKVGNAFTAELSNEQLAFKENGTTIAYISNSSLVITDAEVQNKLSLGSASRGWFDFIPRENGNLSVVWRGSA